MIWSLLRYYYPDQDNQEIRQVQENFYAIAGMPGIVGAIDCTHIPIMSPGTNQAELFRNRKGYFSVNVQAIGDANLIIQNLVVRWPGSTHDSQIFDNSEICARLKNNEIDGILLGNSGYPLKQYQLTPLLSVATHAERRYNFSHFQTRVKIENLFGVWKRRFPCLSMKLCLKLSTSLLVIVACGVLYNIARKNGLPVPDGPDLHMDDIPN
jgi:hypothetical protein